MGRPLVCLVILALCAACAKEPETAPAAQASNSPASSNPAKVSVLPPADAPATDPFAEEYEAVMRQIGRWDGDTKKLDDARERLKTIIASDKAYAPAYVALARCEAEGSYSEENDKPLDQAALDRAWKFVQHALKLAPNDFDAHMTAAWIAVYRGDYDVAEEALRRADELKPRHAEIKLVRASVAAGQQDALQMTRLAKEVIEQSSDPDHRVQAYDFLIAAYESGLHLEEADGAYREQVKLRPESAWVRGNYGAFLLRRDDVDGAIREAEAAMNVRKFPLATATLVRAYIAKAQLEWDAGKISESASFISKVAGLADESADLSFALGKFYEGAAFRGRDASMRQKALAAYRRALELNPQHMEAERAVGRLSRTTS